MDHTLRDPVQTAHKDMVHPGAMGIANGLMIIALKKLDKLIKRTTPLTC